ncbi:hypothetical protein NEOKW01_2091 [Nematocida sp. AWRm80]|nr:hypothetical protein NEOKW01_2091 [Nematocida sp. AWRm80]
MLEYISRLSTGTIDPEERISSIERLIRETNKTNYHLCIAYLLIAEEQPLNISEEYEREYRRVFNALKDHAAKISSAEWVETIEKCSCKIIKEEKKEESTLDHLIDLVIEALITTSTTEIERAVESILEEDDTEDPRVQVSSSTSEEAVEEILNSLLQLPTEEAQKRVVDIAKILDNQYIEILLKYLNTSLGKILPLALYVHNPDLYDALENEFKKKNTPKNYALLEYFPRIDIEMVIKGLYKSSGMFKPLESIMKNRPIYRSRIVEEVIDYIKTGSRTKCILFIKNNLEYFLERIDDLGLGCEEILQLAEKNPVLLKNAIEMMSLLRVELKEKRQQNYQKKEKRLAGLISTISMYLSNLPEPEISAFIEEKYRIDPDLLSKICLGLFRQKAPGEEIKKLLSRIVKEKTSPAFVFTVLSYLDNSDKYSLIEEYLTDDISLTLFLRVLKPENIFIYSHQLDSNVSQRIITLCFSKPETFTDRIVSFSIERLSEKPELPPHFAKTLQLALKAFPNMKPFIASILKKEWFRLLSNYKQDYIHLLEQVDTSAPEILLSIPYNKLESILMTSKLLKDRVEKYLERQPTYIQNNHKKVLSLFSTSSSPEDMPPKKKRKEDKTERSKKKEKKEKK